MSRALRTTWVVHHASSAAVSSFEDWESDPVSTEPIKAEEHEPVAEAAPLGAFKRYTTDHPTV